MLNEGLIIELIKQKIVHALKICFCIGSTELTE